MLRRVVGLVGAVALALALTASLAYAVQGSAPFSLGQEHGARPELIFSPSRPGARTVSRLLDETAGRPSSAEAMTHTTSLPIVARRFCPFPSSDTVPFGIEIAAIHQVVSPTVSGEQTGLLSNPQLRAYLDSAFPSLVAALKESGAGWTRVNIQWEDIEPAAPLPGQDPQYIWGWYDPKLRAIADAGTQIVAIINSAPLWAADPTCGPIKAERLGDYRQFVADLVRHYMQPPYNITHWEIVNEPDYINSGDAWSRGYGCWGSQGAAYSQVLAQAYQAIKSVDPGATVHMGGLAYDAFTEYYGSRGFNRYFIDDVMAAGGGAYADAFSVHYFPDWRPEWERWVAGSQERENGRLLAPACGPDIYSKDTSPAGPKRYEPWGRDLIAKLSHFEGRMRTCFASDKPVWVSELAQHGFLDKSPTLADQARYVIQGNVRGLVAGVKNLMWYALVTPGDPAHQELLYDNLEPKPAFFAFKTLAGELKGYQYSHAVNADGVEGYVFTAPCDPDKTVAWGSRTLTFAASRLGVVDYMGNANRIADGGPGDRDGRANGRITVQLTQDPIFLQIAG